MNKLVKATVIIPIIINETIDYETLEDLRESILEAAMVAIEYETHEMPIIHDSETHPELVDLP